MCRCRHHILRNLSHNWDRRKGEEREHGVDRATENATTQRKWEGSDGSYCWAGFMAPYARRVYCPLIHQMQPKTKTVIKPTAAKAPARLSARSPISVLSFTCSVSIRDRKSTRLNSSHVA